MRLVDFTGLHMPVEPTVDSFEGDTELLGELWLAESSFEPVGVELVNEVIFHSY